MPISVKTRSDPNSGTHLHTMIKNTTADIKWSRRIRERDGMCVICLKSDKMLNAHHLVPKNFEKWRHDMDNGITLCVHCHQFGKFSAHKNPLWFAQWMRVNKKYEFLKAMERLNEET